MPGLGMLDIPDAVSFVSVLCPNSGCGTFDSNAPVWSLSSLTPRAILRSARVVLRRLGNEGITVHFARTPRAILKLSKKGEGWRLSGGGQTAYQTQYQAVAAG